MQNNENQTQHSKSWCSQICCCKKKNKKLIQIVEVEEKTENLKPKEIRFTDQIDIIENEIESFSESIIQHQQFIHNARELNLNSLVVYKLTSTEVLMSQEQQDMSFDHSIVKLLGDY